ncbi:tetratricopeptide repeat protein [Variovorax sp. 770b2]|uniref:tetratricopeptide repeat protein n=1 Tax=Variovorax sp. 770b2 TaxID=1566271 RepID=UPI0008ED1DB9|nr:tetratricopeptide repeat protein [Variovorax sp. 770b2]SFQ11286.1 Tetratricopeptide repeat-containing protein [Variovorax sp. 770b2]
MNTTSTAYTYAALSQGGDSSAELDDLGEAFAAALRRSDWSEAQRCLHAAADREEEDAAAWALRRGDWFLAQQRWDDAESHLKGLLAADEPADDPFQMAVRHNLASIAFMRRDDAGCVAWLSPLLEVDGVARSLPSGFLAAQMLWVRALHRSHAVDRLLRWVAQLDASGQLDPAVAGIASLASWERGDVASARRWVATGRSRGEAVSAECLVAAVFLSIADRGSHVEIGKLAEEACARWPADGRGWAVRGLAKLLAGDAESANSDLERAIATAPHYALAWRGIGWAQILLGEPAVAEHSFLSALKLDDRHPESHGGLAVSLLMQRREAEARDCLSMCQNLDAESRSGAYAERLLVRHSEVALDLAEVLAGLD